MEKGNLDIVGKGEEHLGKINTSLSDAESTPSLTPDPLTHRECIIKSRPSIPRCSHILCFFPSHLIPCPRVSAGLATPKNNNNYLFHSNGPHNLTPPRIRRLSSLQSHGPNPSTAYRNNRFFVF